MQAKTRKEARQRRHRRVRKKIGGCADRPRMAIAKSGRHMYVQFIDDDNGLTLAAVSTRSCGCPLNVEGARTLGKRAAEVAVGKGIRAIVIDRGGFKFHGRIRAVVESALEGGLSTSMTSADTGAEAGAPEANQAEAEDAQAAEPEEQEK